MKRSTKAQPTTAGGSICGNKVYSLQGYCRELKIGQKTWYSMRDAGLRSCKIGKQVFILGRDAIEFFDKLAEEQAAGGDVE